MLTRVPHEVLLYHDTGLYYGSTEKLLQTIARHLDSARFRVHFLYGDKGTGAPRASYLKGHVNLIRFEYERRDDHPPYRIRRMRPHINRVIEEHRIEAIVLAIWGSYLFPLTDIPSTIPIVAVSPFGDWYTNGGVIRTYCSGTESLARARRSGSPNAELFFNPSPGPPAGLREKPPPGRPIIFGRIGRDDDGIFDPIALQAFVRLEAEFGDAVRYDVVAPPPKMRALAEELGARRVRFLAPIIDEDELWTFYRDIDVFAHARADGETLGMAIAEAMLAGNPVITHKSRLHNDHIALLESTYARWVAPGDVEGYLAAMRWFVEHPARIRPMGKLAREATHPKFALKTVMARIERDLETACLRCTYWTPSGRLRGLVETRARAVVAAARSALMSGVRAVVTSSPLLHRLARRLRAMLRTDQS